MYAITGITGHVGGVTGNLLLAQHLPIRAVVRNPAKAQEWTDNGAETALAEFHDAEAVAKAFQGADGVFVMTPPLFDAADPIADHDQMLAAISLAIEKAQPKKIVYLSSVGAHLPHGTGAIKKLYDMEQAFKRLSTPTVGIRAAWFMENFTGSIPYAKEKGILPSFLAPTNLTIPMVAACDIGKLAADLLVENWGGHRIVELEGPCRYSADDVATVLSYQLERTVTAIPIQAEKYEDTYLSFGATPAAAKMMEEMNKGFNSGWISFEETVAHVSGETLLEDALKTYIHA